MYKFLKHLGAHLLGHKGKQQLLSGLTYFVCLKLPFFFKFLALFRPQRKKLLIIKTDAIGDYILFRNFIEEIKHAEVFKDYRIDLLGNTLWKELTDAYDSKYINSFTGIRNDDFYLAPLKTLKLGWHLFQNNYAVVLQPSSTRIFITDALAALSAAGQIIGFASDTEGILAEHKTKFDNFYSQKLSLPTGCYFEFDRNLFFFETVLHKTISIKQPSLPVTKTTRKGIMIAPGAGVLKRRWGSEKFLSLIQLALHNSTEDIYLLGSAGECDIAGFLESTLNSDRVINLTGKLSLVELVETINAAQLVIANETSAIHIAVATGTKAVCILGGGHFNRFAPYPDQLADNLICVHEKLECYYCNWNCIYKVEDFGTYPCISFVDTNRVWLVADQLLRRSA